MSSTVGEQSRRAPRFIPGKGLKWALFLVSSLTSMSAPGQLRADLMEKFARDRWDPIPLSSEDPTVAIRLCQQPHTDSCTVVAEIYLSVPQEVRQPRSLEDELAKWNAAPARKVVEPAQKTKLGGREAIEVAVEGEHSIHIQKIVVHDTIVMRDGDRYARCIGWSEPPDHAAFRRAMQDFCASYDLSTLNPQ